MTIFDFEGIVRSEREARSYLLGRCRRVCAPRCPACSRGKLYTIENGSRRRCAQCGHTFNPFSGRWLNEVKLSAREWLWVVKLFGLEMPATVIADEIGISYPTGLKAIDAIRAAIAAAAGDAASETEAETLPWPVGCPKHGAKAADFPPSVPRDTILLRLHINGDHLILAKKELDYASVSCCGRVVPVVDLGRNYPHYRVYCNAAGFWPYAKERLMKYHGVSSAKLYLYLREMEFRWMHRDGELFEAVIDRLCAFMPSRTSGGDMVHHGQQAARQ